MPIEMPLIPIICQGPRRDNKGVERDHIFIRFGKDWTKEIILMQSRHAIGLCVFGMIVMLAGSMYLAKRAGF